MSPEARRGRRARLLRSLLVLALVLLVVAGSVAAWLYRKVAPDTCRTLPRADLSIEEMIAVKQRVEHYQRESTAPLRLNGREASFLLADTLEYPVHITVTGEVVGAQLALPAGAGARCYHVDFRGEIAVEEGVAMVVPSRLIVGELDLSGWFGGTAVRVDPQDLFGEHARGLLARTRRLQVQDGHLLVNMDVGGLR